MVKKWSLYWVILDPVIGSEQADRRPVLVISNDIVNEILPIVTVIPVASVKDKFKVYPTEVFLPSEKSALPKDSLAMIHQIRTISKERLTDSCGSIDDDMLRNKVNAVLTEYFDL